MPQLSFDETIAPAFLTRLSRLGAGLVLGRQPLFALLQAVGMQVFIAIINILTGVITARMLGPEGRGIYTAVTTWPQLLATLAVSGLSSAVVFRMRKFPESAGRVASAALLLGAAQAVIAIVVGLFLLPAFLAKYDARTVAFAQSCLASVLIFCTFMMIKQCFSGAGEFKQLNLANLRPQIMYLGVLILLIPFGAVNSTSAILALLGTGALAVAVTLPRFFRMLRPSLSGSLQETRSLLSYAARAAPMDMVFALSTNADRIVLIPMLSATELGFYAVAYSFSRVLQLVQPAITSVIFSHMAGRSESDGKRLHDHALRFLLAALAAGSAVLWVAGKPLLVFTYGPGFAAAKTVFRLLLVEASLGSLSQVTIQLFLSRDRPGAVSTIQVIVLLVSVGALLVLVPRYGAVGAAIGLVAAGTVRWLLLLASIRMSLRLQLPRLHLRREDLQYLLGRLR